MTNASATKILSRKTRTMTNTTVSTTSRKTSLTTGASAALAGDLGAVTGAGAGGAAVAGVNPGRGSFSPSLAAIRHLCGESAGAPRGRGSGDYYAGIAGRRQGQPPGRYRSRPSRAQSVTL